MRLSTFSGLAALATLVAVTSAQAADDPSIAGQQRIDIKTAMTIHIDRTTIDNKYVIYDPTIDTLHQLTFDNLHEGVVKKGDFYVSCADFVDEDGIIHDIDFLVAEGPEGFRVLQALVHAIDGDKRKYHVE